jgi:hypothetical protein
MGYCTAAALRMEPLATIGRTAQEGRKRPQDAQVTPSRPWKPLRKTPQPPRPFLEPYDVKASAQPAASSHTISCPRGGAFVSARQRKRAGATRLAPSRRNWLARQSKVTRRES